MASPATHVIQESTKSALLLTKNKKGALKTVKSFFSKRGSRKRTKVLESGKSQAEPDSGRQQPKRADTIPGLTYMKHAEGKEFWEHNKFVPENKIEAGGIASKALAKKLQSNSDEATSMRRIVPKLDERTPDIVASTTGGSKESEQNHRNERAESREQANDKTFTASCDNATVLHRSLQIRTRSTPTGSHLNITSAVRPEVETKDKELKSRNKAKPVNMSKGFWMSAPMLISLVVLCVMTTILFWYTRNSCTDQPESIFCRSGTLWWLVLVLMLVVLVGIIWYGWRCRMERKRQREEEAERRRQMAASLSAAKKGNTKPDFSFLGVIFTMVICVALPVLALRATIYSLQKVLGSLERFLGDFLPKRQTVNHENTMPQRKPQTGPGFRHQPLKEGGSDQYKLTIGEAILVLFIPILIPFMLFKATKRARAKIASSNIHRPGNQPSPASYSTLRNIIQGAISKCQKPNSSGPRYSRTPHNVGKPQLRYMLSPRPHGRPCRCKCNCAIM